MLHQDDSKLRLQASQRSMASLEKLYHGSISNHRNVAIEIKGAINQEIFLQAFSEIVKRHSILNAHLDEDEEGPFLNLNSKEKSSAICFNYFDASHLQSAPHVLDLYETLKQINKESFIESPFDLDRGPLYRLALVKIKENVHQLLMLFNHIIIDESSIGIILQDLSTCYNAIFNQKNHDLANIFPLTTYDFSIKNESYQTRLEYWKEQLTDLNALNLPTDYLPISFQFKGKRHRFKLEKSLVNKINHTDILKDITLNQKILACLFVLLHRYSDQTKICVGITSANRRFESVPQEIANRLVNCFFNSIPILPSFSENSTFVDLALEVKKVLSNGLKNQLPIDVIYEEALSSETTSKLTFASPFNILFVLNQKKPTLTLENTSASYPVELDLGRCKFPFGLNLDEVDDGFECFIEYNTDLFNETTIKRIAQHLLTILDYVAKDPNCIIANIPFLLDEEKTLINNYNKTELAPVFNGCVHEFFQQQAEKFPNDIAVVFHCENGTKETITYQALDIASSFLTAHLLKLGVKPGNTVGICLPSSINYIIAILGVMKAGGVFVPTEPDILAKEVLNYKISTTQASVVIVDDHSSPLIDNSSLHLLNMNLLYHLEQTSHAEYSSFPVVDLKDPVYIMFTSGSSGETPMPKGVISLHQGFTNLLNGLSSQFLKEGLKTISTAPPDFDAILYDFLVAIVTHGQIHLIFNEGRYSPQILHEISIKENIDYGVFMPYTLDLLDPQDPYSTIVCMGASPHEETLVLWKNANPERKVYNAFGVTEAGICNSFFLFEPGQNCTIIGTPIPNIQIHILDKYLRPCPLGVRGQVYISGPGVAAGYLNHPELTKKKFFSLSFDADTFSFRINETSSRRPNFYATGDYGCYVLTKDGLAVRFMGRMNRFVKLLGALLIDLNMVESILNKHPLVQNVIVKANKDETALTAYIIPSTPHVDFTVISQEISDYLHTTMLPAIAHPHSIHILPSWPLTPNGKIDLNQLPETLDTPISELSEPTSDLQALLQDLWAKALHRSDKNQIAIDKSFQALGGKSLSLAKLEWLINIVHKTELNLMETAYIGFNILKKSMTIASLEIDLQPYLNFTPCIEFLPPNVFFDGNSIVFFQSKKENTESTINKTELEKNNNFNLS